MLSIYPLIRPFLFGLDAEQSHDKVMAILAKISRSKGLCQCLTGIQGIPVELANRPVNVMGLTFANPLGLAAGLDKHAMACDAFASLGFGFVEMGTVTPVPQPGNPKPRLFRLPRHDALINRFGFNSVGVTQFIKNLQTARCNIIKGINIGKNAATPLENAVDDYVWAMQQIYPYADYITINISSPNTQNLRNLQRDEQLGPLLAQLDENRKKLADQHGKRVPVAVKVAPDMDRQQVEAIANLLRMHHVDALIATNTTVNRNAVANHPLSTEVGVLSGSPLRAASTELIAAFKENLQDEIPIIGVGGIDSAKAAMEKLQAGAMLLQVYTGFIYQGPRLIRDILSAL